MAIYILAITGYKWEYIYIYIHMLYVISVLITGILGP